MKEITSRKNPLVAQFRALARRRLPHQTSVLLEGVRLVEEAVQAGLTIACAAVSRPLARQTPVAALLDRLERDGAEIVAVTDAVMNAVSPAPSPSGLIAIAEMMPAGLDRAFAEAPQLVLIPFDLQDPGNAGAVVRSAEALGATAVVFCGASADPYGWKALRGSMGSAFRLPVVARADGHAAIDAARRAGLSVIASVPTGGCDIVEFDLGKPTALLLGGEGSGLDSSIVAAADATVSIPMSPSVESLNVSVAAAIIAWEARRQRTRRRGRGRHG